LQFGFGDEAQFQANLRVMERIAPEHFSTLALRGMYLAAKGDFPGAKSALNSALADSRAEQSQEIAGQLFYFRSLCHQHLQDIDATRRDVDESLRRNRKNVAAWKIKGGISYQQQRYADAFLEFSQGLSIAPDDVECLSGKAECFLTTGQYSDAARNYEAAWTLAPNDANAKKGAVYSVIAALTTDAFHPAPTDLFLWPNIPEAKFNGALQGYIKPFQVSPAESVLLLFDATLLGGCEDGFCLTEEAIYWHNAWEASRFYRIYSTIAEVKTDAGKVTLNGQGILGLGQCGPFLQTLLLRLRELFRQSNSSKQVKREQNSHAHYFHGMCENANFGIRAPLSLRLELSGNRASGLIELFGLGGSGEIEGALNGSEIHFASVDRPAGFKVEWTGTLTGKLIKGTYNVLDLKNRGGGVQGGMWQAEWSER
jgi:tetratricopeptide (TPR) repeat protein